MNRLFAQLPFFLLLLPLLLLAGCQSKVYLMPPPISVQPENLYFFDQTEDSKDSNFPYTLYATNRIPLNDTRTNLSYTIFPSDKLRIGFVVHSVGDSNLSWEEFMELSAQQKRKKNLLIKKEYVREVTQQDLEESIEKTSPQADGLFDKINEILQVSFSKDIIVYVHGANSNFYRATAQGAQLHHYTGHNALTLTFSWPSAESLLKYKVDVMHAEKTVPVFVRLLETLSTYTDAKNIDIVAYSAGAQVVAPALADIPAMFPALTKEEIKNKFRIGDVYFAAPDTDFKPFAERYLAFKDIVDRTTININRHDTVLQLAAFQNGLSRLGIADIDELDDHEKQIMIDAMQTPYFNVINAGDSEGLKIGRAHDFWYTNPWVSNDLLLLLLFGVSAEERGLKAIIDAESAAKVYYFPNDYEHVIKRILDENRDKSKLQNSLNSEEH